MLTMNGYSTRNLTKVTVTVYNRTPYITNLYKESEEKKFCYIIIHDCVKTIMIVYRL